MGGSGGLVSIVSWEVYYQMKTLTLIFNKECLVGNKLGLIKGQVENLSFD